MPEAGNESILRFEKVSVAFGDDEPVLRDISFDVRHGETRVILGAASSGKTVLLKTAMGLLHATSGKIFLFDQDVTNIPESKMFEVRGKIGMLFQESALF